VGATAKQRANIYTVMLIVAFVALVLASVLMYLELKKYEFDIEAKEYDRAEILQPERSQSHYGPPQIV
tara:strand:+ start:227 stop:430 length:204 start_codon:yes stop_codon:yes gene_type:complete